MLRVLVVRWVRVFVQMWCAAYVYVTGGIGCRAKSHVHACCMFTCVQETASFYRTLVLHHRDCLELDSFQPGSTRWEAPVRIRAILHALRNEKWFRATALTFREQFAPATQEMLERAHSKQCVQCGRTTHTTTKHVLMPAPHIVLLPQSSTVTTEPPVACTD